MPNPEDERRAGLPPQAPDDQVGIGDLASAQPLEVGPRISIGEDFDPVIVDFPEAEAGSGEDASPMRVVDGVIELDKKTLESELDSVTDWLEEGVRNGDDKVLQVYLRNLQDVPGSDEEKAELRHKIEESFRTRDPSPLQLLKELHVNIVSAGIAERNLIRQGIRPELDRQPFYLEGKDGRPLSGEKDLDIVIAKGKGKKGEIKIIVGSKRGISAIALLKDADMTPDKFRPNKQGMSKDATHDVIIIPLTEAADGTAPMATSVEIHKGPIDLIDTLARQDQADAARKAREEHERRRREVEEARSYYNPGPPSPAPGRWTSPSG